MADSQYYVSESDVGALFRLSGLPAEFQRLFARDYVSLKQSSSNISDGVSELTIRVDDIDDSLTLTISNLSALTSSYNSHAAASSAHGATGNIVGTDNFATLILGGTVKLAAAVADQAVSTVSVTSANANAAAAAYSQADTALVVALANELKVDVNQLVVDLNSLTAKVNTILASDRTALQRAP